MGLIHMRRTDAEEIEFLLENRRKLNARISALQSKISKLEQENKKLKEKADAAEASVFPLRDTVNKLTAEKSKWMRKNKE